MTVTWMDAKAADGPKVVAWLEEHVDLYCVSVRDGRGRSITRRMFDWRRPGALAQFDAVDRALTYFGRHISELPDDVWLDHASRGSMTTAPVVERDIPDPPSMIAPRYCLGCGDEIPKVKPSGGRVSPSEYAKRTFCSQPCQWEGHLVTATSGDFARNAFRGKAA